MQVGAVKVNYQFGKDEWKLTEPGRFWIWYLLIKRFLIDPPKVEIFRNDESILFESVL